MKPTRRRPSTKISSGRGLCQSAASSAHGASRSTNPAGCLNCATRELPFGSITGSSTGGSIPPLS